MTNKTLCTYCGKLNHCQLGACDKCIQKLERAFNRENKKRNKKQQVA